MRGELTATSKPGVGSTFTVRLPTTAEALEPVSQQAAPDAAARKRVLVVDDEPQLAVAMARILGGQHEVVLAHGGREALDLLAKDDGFDRVFCDLMMSDVSGMDVHAELSARHPALLERFVFTTGGAFSERARTFLQSVPLPRIEKPFDPGVLRALVEGAPPRAEALRAVARGGVK
jgi:DNA-binding NtrC family response regulator